MEEQKEIKQTKICRDCKEEKEYNLLVPAGKSKRTGETLMKNICKKCFNKRRELARSANRSPAREEANKRRWHTANSGEKGKNKRLKLKFGITLEEYNAMIEVQDNKCLICKRELNKPVVDHSHESGKIRGVLCSNCNTGIGLLEDNIEILENAIKYLQGSNV